MRPIFVILISFLVSLWKEPPKNKRQKSRSILDIGCGAGRDTLYFADLNYKVTALDLSAKALSLFQEIPKNVEFICDDIKNVNFAADSFDLVYANLTLHYFDNQTTKRVIANITQSLTSGGVLTFLCKSTKNPLYGVGTRVEDNVYDDRYRHHFDNNYIKELFDWLQCWVSSRKWGVLL